MHGYSLVAPVKTRKIRKHGSVISNALRVQMDGQQTATELLLQLSRFQDKPNVGVNPRRLGLMTLLEHGTSSKQRFIRRFRPAGFEDKLQHELYTISQGQNETVMLYAERVKTAAQALGKTSSSDRDAIARVWIVGLRSEIRRHVLFQRPNTYALAVDYACRAEEAEGQSTGPLLHVVEEPKNLVSQLSLEDITKGLADLSLLARVKKTAANGRGNALAGTQPTGLS